MAKFIRIIISASLVLLVDSAFAGDYDYCSNKTRQECSSKCPNPVTDSVEAYQACSERCTKTVFEPCFSGASRQSGQSNNSGAAKVGSQNATPSRTKQSGQAVERNTNGAGTSYGSGATNCLSLAEENGRRCLKNSCSQTVEAGWCIKGKYCSDSFNSRWNIGSGKCYPVERGEIIYGACPGADTMEVLSNGFRCIRS